MYRFVAMADLDVDVIFLTLDTGNEKEKDWTVLKVCCKKIVKNNITMNNNCSCMRNGRNNEQKFDWKFIEVQ